MDVLFAAHAAVKDVVPVVVMRHRAAGILTWSLLHKIESEVLAEVAVSGKHSSRILDMLRAPEGLNYPKNDHPVSFEGSEFVPIIYGEIADAWRRVN
ncbi:DUF2471 family protein [Paraburkholderia unamae]|uniref:Uncharacterized protein DUF2471 n=2 Tax=Paraburkholderia unamae TaxID=219649 RepID=A0ABX5KWV7_9BURK|nr:DUF2471 family protein [Paraburkholderia unamae]PVX85560.1 uncharacterized protein DUF2471 [Paraburkholderia unamae]RAR55231.1 uncharacterized protein DUF2471 [Paraburkholderia unamae]